MNKKIINLFVIFSLVATLNSCKKDKDLHTTVKGQVLDATTSTSIKGASVFLEARGDCFSCGKQTIASTVSDANGNFSFDFTASEGNIYSLAASKHRYYDNTGNYGPSTTLTTGEENKKNIVLKPEAYLKLYIKNVNNNDEISLGAPCQSSSSCVFGGNVDTFQVYKVYGNEKNDIVWFVYKNSVQTKGNGSVYCPAFDTTSYSINY